MANQREVSFLVSVKDAASSVLQQIAGAAQKTTSSIFSMGDVLKGFGGVISAISLGAIIKDIIDLGVASDTTFRQIAANLPTGVAGIADLREELNQLAIQSGRSLDEVQGLAGEIAKMGVGSAGAVAQEARAAITLSDATGASAQESAQLLIQLRREFGLTDDQAMKTAADLAQAARGRADVAELFATFQRAAPIFQKFSIDVATGTNAIVALVEAGHSARAIGGELGKMDAEGIRELGAEAKTTADSLTELQTRAALVEDSTARAGERVKTEFQARLETLGTYVAGVLNPALKAFNDLIDPAQRKIDRALDNMHELVTGPSAAGNVSVDQQNAIADLERMLAQKGANPVQLFSSESPADLEKVITTVQALNVVDGQHQHLLDALTASLNRANEAEATNTAAQQAAIAASNKRVAAIIAASEARVEAAKHADEARTKIAALGVEFDRLSASNDQATSKSQQFALAIEAYKQRAEAAHLPTDALNSDLETLNAKLAKLKAQDAADLATAIQKALGELTGNTADAASDAIERQVKAWGQAIAATDSYDIKTRATLYNAIAQWEKLKPVVDAAAESIRKAQSTVATVESHGPGSDFGTLAGDQTSLQSRLFDLEDQRRALVANGATTASKEYLDVQREIDAVQKELDTVGKRILTNATDVVKPAKDTLATITAQARAIRDAVDGALQLGAAFHLVSENTAAALRDVSEIVTQIPVFAKALSEFRSDAKDPNTGNPLATLTSVITAGLPILGGVASLVSALTAPSPQEQAHVKALQDNSLAIQQLTKGLTSLSISGSSFASAEALMQGIVSGQRGSLVEKDFGHGAKIDFVAETAEDFQQLQAFAKSLGLTFDGSVESFRQLQQAAAAAGMFLGKLGTDYQSEQTYYSGLASIQGLTGVAAFNTNALAGASQSPFLANLLGGFDLNSQAGRDAAKQQLLGAYQRGAPNSTNPFTAQELGGLTTDQLEQAIQQWEQALNQLPPVFQAVTDKLKTDLSDLSQKASVLGEGPVAQLGDKVQTYAKDFGSAFSMLSSGLDLTKQSDIDAFKKRLQELYQGLEAGTATVDTSVFSIDDWKNAIADLVGSVDSAASSFESAAQKITDAESEIAIGDDILGTSGPSSIAEYASAYGIDLSAFDLTNQAGVGGAISYIQGLFKGLDPNDPDFATKEHEYQSLVDKLRPLITTGNATGGSAASIPSISDSYNQSATGSVTAISSAEAGGIIGELQTSNVYLSTLPDIRDALTKWINPGLGSLPSFSRGGVGLPLAGTFAGGAQPLEVIAVVNLNGKEIALAVAQAMLDPQVGQQIGRSLTRSADRASSGIGLPRSG